MRFLIKLAILLCLFFGCMTDTAAKTHIQNFKVFIPANAIPKPVEKPDKPDSKEVKKVKKVSIKK